MNDYSQEELAEKELAEKMKKWLDDYYEDPVPMIKKHGFDTKFYEDMNYSLWHDDEVEPWDIMLKEFGFKADTSIYDIFGFDGEFTDEIDDYFYMFNEPSAFVEDENGNSVKDEDGELIWSKYFRAIGASTEPYSEKYDLSVPYWIPEEIVEKFDQELKKELEKEKSKALKQAKEHEEFLEFEKAAKIYRDYGMKEDVIRVRKLKNKDRKVIHGDTIIKDSVVSKSNVGSSSDDKFSKLERLAEMKEKGLIDDDEFKQMKKDILGK